MALRKNALDVSLFTLGGVSFLESVKSWDFNIDVTDDDCRVAVERYHESIPVKKKLEFSISRNLKSGAFCQTNLNVSVWSVDGSSFLAELKSGSVSINSDVEDGSGVADIWEFPNVLGTDAEIQCSQLVTTQASLFHIAGENNVTGVQVDLILTLGGTTISIPATMTAASHKIEEGQLQMQDVTFKLRGEPTLVSGDAMVVEIFTGDAFLSWAANVDSGQYAGNAVITQTTINFQDAQIIGIEHTLANQGAPSITVS